MLQKKHITLIVFGVILSLFIAGCDGGEVTGGDSTTPFLEGTQGLEIGFLQGSPPKEISDITFPFDVVVSLKNQGEHDVAVNDVRVNLMGILPSDFGTENVELTNAHPDADLTSRKKDSEGNVIDAVEAYATFPKDDTKLQLQPGVISGNVNFVFRADVCYKYKTKATSQICVLKNLVSVADDAICSPTESKSIFSSGSPIDITSFRQGVVGEDKIQFSFDIVHSESGNVFKPMTPTDFVGCPKDSSTRRLEEDKVKITIKTGIAETLKCSGIGSTTDGTLADKEIKLVNGKRTMTCTQDLPASSDRNDYEKSIDITVDFNYLDKIDRTVLAKHIG